MPTFNQLMVGRRLGDLGASSAHRPPWPWPLRRLGEEPEDWAGDGYSAYYGLEFPTELHIPCDSICDFLVGATWTLEGTYTNASLDVDAGGPLLPYSVSSSVEGATAELGESCWHDFDTNGTTILSSTAAGVSWQDLDTPYEVLPFSRTDGGGAGIAWPDGIVRIRATQYVDGTSANAPPDDLLGFVVEYWAVVHLPELCKNETGDLVWRIKMVGGVEVTTAISLFPVDSDIGLEFVDNDIPANSTVLEPSATGFTLKLSITRAP